LFCGAMTVNARFGTVCSGILSHIHCLCQSWWFSWTVFGERDTIHCVWVWGVLLFIADSMRFLPVDCQWWAISSSGTDWFVRFRLKALIIIHFGIASFRLPRQWCPMHKTWAA
jgi:hypothetical protein